MSIPKITLHNMMIASVPNSIMMATEGWGEAFILKEGLKKGPKSCKEKAFLKGWVLVTRCLELLDGRCTLWRTRMVQFLEAMPPTIIAHGMIHQLFTIYSYKPHTILIRFRPLNDIIKCNKKKSYIINSSLEV